MPEVHEGSPASGPLRRLRRPAAAEVKTLIISDVHAPHHDERAYDAAYSAWTAFSPDTIVILGDFADCESLSAHQPEGPRRFCRIEKELLGVNELLDGLDELGADRKIYVCGNHEFRLPRYLALVAPELSGAVSLRRLLHLKRRGWEWVDYRRSVSLDGVTYTHDVQKSGRYAHVTAAERNFAAIATGHTHRLGVHYLGGADKGPRVFGLSCGHLSGPAASEYMHPIQSRHEWQLGFATVVDGRPRGHAGDQNKGRATVELDGCLYSS